MAVAADEREAHVVGGADTLVDEAASLHAAGGGDGAEPVDVVLDDEQTAGGDEGSQHVVVLGHRARLGRVAVQALAEPHVLADDLAGRLDVGAAAALRVRDTPAGSTTRAGLLRESEGDAVDESADDEGALAVARATGSSQARGVDAGLLRAELDKAVDDTVNTPGPGGQGTSRVAVTEEGVEGTLAAGLAGRLRGEVVVAEADSADSAGNGQRGTADGDDGWARAAAGLADGRADGDRLGADRHLDGHGAAGERGLDLVGRRRVVAQLELLQQLADLLRTARPVGLGGDLPAILEGERIGQLGVVDGRVAVRDGAGRVVLALVDVSVGEGPCCGAQQGGDSQTADHCWNAQEEKVCAGKYSRGEDGT